MGEAWFNGECSWVNGHCIFSNTTTSTIMDYHGLSWTIMDYHGLTWTIMDYLMDRQTDTQIDGHLVHCSVAIMTENQKKKH